MADAEHSKCFVRKGVWVRVPPPAPNEEAHECASLLFQQAAPATLAERLLADGGRFFDARRIRGHDGDLSGIE